MSSYPNHLARQSGLVGVVFLTALGLLTGFLLFSLDVVHSQALDLPAAPAASGTATTEIATREAVSSLQPAPGEILLEGIVQSMAPDGGSLTLQASRFTLPGKASHAISPARLKIVSTAGQEVVPGSAPLSVGCLVQVVGPDEGTGTSLSARSILVLATSGTKRIPAKGTLNLAKLQGKTLSEYEQVLGEPFQVKRLQNETQDELRYYKYPGFTSIRLSRQGANGQLTDSIYAVECVFPKTAVTSWQQALKRIGYSPAGVKTRYVETAEEEPNPEDRIKTRCPWLEGIPGIAFAQWEIAGLPRDDRKEAHWPIDHENHHLYLSTSP